MTKLKYTTLIDFILAVLKLIRDQKANKYVSLIRILEVFRYQSSISEIQELGRYMEAKGWVKLILIIGDVRVQITTRGLIYIEEKGESFMKDFEVFRQSLKEEAPHEDRIIKLFNEEEDPKHNIQKMLREVSEEIKRRGDSPDFLRDIEIISLEISKTYPDLRMIEVKLTALASLSYLSSQIQELKDYLIPF